MALIDLLLNGKVEEFNQTRGHRAPLDLYAADLSNLPLGGVDLSGANLQKADLSGSDLTDAVLAKSDLSGADLTGTILKGAFPFMVCMVVAILILCVFPGLATWLPSLVMGK